MEEVGLIIKERRRLLSITQRELAALARVGINTLTKIEKGEANPSFDVLHRILTTLGLEIEIKVKNADYKKLYYEKSNRVLARNFRRRTNRGIV